MDSLVLYRGRLFIAAVALGAATLALPLTAEHYQFPNTPAWARIAVLSLWAACFGLLGYLRTRGGSAWQLLAAVGFGCVGYSLLASVVVLAGASLRSAGILEQAIAAAVQGIRDGLILSLVTLVPVLVHARALRQPSWDADLELLLGLGGWLAVMSGVLSGVSQRQTDSLGFGGAVLTLGCSMILLGGAVRAAREPLALLRRLLNSSDAAAREHLVSATGTPAEHSLPWVVSPANPQADYQLLQRQGILVARLPLDLRAALRGLQRRRVLAGSLCGAAMLLWIVWVGLWLLLHDSVLIRG